MVNRLIILILGCFIIFPCETMAQDNNSKKPAHSFKENRMNNMSQKKEDGDVSDPKNLSPQDQPEEPIKKDGLYHIVITTQDQKSQDIWIKLDKGEEKFVTIKLDNGTKKRVSIQLDDEKQAGSYEFPPYKPPYGRISQLTLQPISF